MEDEERYNAIERMKKGFDLTQFERDTIYEYIGELESKAHSYDQQQLGAKNPDATTQVKADQHTAVI